MAARIEITPKRCVGDTAYGAAPVLARLVEGKAIAPHVPVWDEGLSLVAAIGGLNQNGRH